LGAAGLVRSRPGPGGGYELSRPTDQVTILDVVVIVSPIERIRSCPLGLTSHTSLCPLHRELDQAYAATEKAFASVTIRQLLESHRAPNVTVAWQGMAPISAPPETVACGLNLYDGGTGSVCTDDLCRRVVTTVVRIPTLTI
jgi:hypothetical protein